MTHSGQTGIIIQSGGYRLLGTLFMARGDAPKPTALILHGIPGIEKNYDLAHTLRYHGWNALIFHYRGCWGSHGTYNLRTIPEDVRAAMDELTNGKYPVVDPKKLVLIGHSLGGWAAVLTAALDPRARAVAALCAVTDPKKFTLHDPNHARFYTPWLTGIHSDELAKQWAGLDDQFSPIKQVQKISPRPLLIVHADTDEEVSVEHARLLYAYAEEPKQIALHPDANHAFTWHRPWLREQVVDWLENVALDEKTIPARRRQPATK
jgi:dipeptidyl aminopeptidase/acylaminoacyl peptidase